MGETFDIPPSPTNLEPIFIAGPTAVGKSAVALALAEQAGGEIISVDSMQVYRGLDLGTAKPTGAERTRVPHHLIDICDLREAFDAAQFVERARRAMAEIQARGRRPVLCGGTGFYFTALLEGLGNAPPRDHALRAELTATPLEQLLAELQAQDPATFQQIDRQNPRRVIRAVEVIRLTGRKFSEQRSAWTGDSKDAQRAGDSVGSASAEPVSEVENVRFLCLTRAPADLHRRIEVRVDEMFARGLVEETRRLLDQGLPGNETAMQAIGYRQVVEHLRGERGLPETIQLVKSRTRQFAKRQLTWLRRRSRGRWLELRPDESVAETLERIAALPAGPQGS